MTTSAANVYWLTGLSGFGKTTMSLAVADRLTERGSRGLVLDGDLLRAGLCADLGFSSEDRRENIRRAGEISCLAALQGYLCLCSFITPCRDMRDRLRCRLGGLYQEIYLHCSLDVCMARDPKQNYRRARQGVQQGYTGLDAPYEPPKSQDLLVETDRYPIEVCAQMIVEYVQRTASPEGR